MAVGGWRISAPAAFDVGEGAVQEVAQLGRCRGDGGGDEGLGGGERGQYGVSLCRVVADDVRLALVA